MPSRSEERLSTRVARGTQPPVAIFVTPCCVPRLQPPRFLDYPLPPVDGRVHNRRRARPSPSTCTPTVVTDADSRRRRCCRRPPPPSTRTTIATKAGCQHQCTRSPSPPPSTSSWKASNMDDGLKRFIFEQGTELLFFVQAMPSVPSLAGAGSH